MTRLVAWCVAFGLTCALEVPIVAWGTRGSEARRGRALGVALLAQACTHPLVWFAFPALPLLGPEPRFYLSELFAWGAEATLYWWLLRGVSGWRALGVAGLANATSLAAGLLLGDLLNF